MMAFEALLNKPAPFQLRCLLARQAPRRVRAASLVDLNPHLLGLYAEFQDHQTLTDCSRVPG